MDVELVIRAQRGDQAAFARMAQACDARFHGVAYGILRDMTLAEDAVQSAYLSMWRDLPSLRDPAAFEAWAYRLLLRSCQAQGRRARRWLPGIAEAFDRGHVDRGFAGILDRDELERAFRRLSLEQRAIVVLRHYLDLPLARIADTLGIPEGTARSRLHRAVQALRASLEADARGPDVAGTVPPEAAR